MKQSYPPYNDSDEVRFEVKKLGLKETKVCGDDVGDNKKLLRRSEIPPRERRLARDLDSEKVLVTRRRTALHRECVAIR